MKNAVKLTVLGTRGSMPTSREDMRLFGGETSCYRLEAGDQTLYLDAGTGLFGERFDGPTHILLSHAHLDHLLGLPMCPALTDPEGEVHLYGASRGGLTLEEQVERLFSPPLWPVRLRDFPARVLFHPLTVDMTIGLFRVTPMEGCHPGGSTIYRVEALGKSVVYATDFEHFDNRLEALIRLSADADLLLYDGAYTDEEYALRQGFGHSTAEMGLFVQRESGAKALRIIHHDFRGDDEKLLDTERRLGIRLARQGEVIAL